MILRILATGCVVTLLFPLSMVAQARQGAPSMDGMADAIQKRQAEEMKQNYGFNDAQTKRYFQKQAKINTDTQARLTLLRKKMVATKDKVEKRQVAKQMRDVLAASDKKMYVALLSIATPGQRPRISPNQ